MRILANTKVISKETERYSLFSSNLTTDRIIVNRKESLYKKKELKV